MTDGGDVREHFIENRFPRLRVITDSVAAWIASGLSEPEYMELFDEEQVSIAKEEFERAFAVRSTQYTILVGLTVAFVWVVDHHVAMLSNQVYGLAIDLLGAIILGRGLVMSPSQIVATATTGYGTAPVFRAKQAQDAVDGIWGITLLIVGILVQGIAVIGLV